MKKLLIFLSILFPIVTTAQVEDDFEDGNLEGWTQNGMNRWEAVSTNPINGSYSLHHCYDETVSGYYHDQISIPFGSFNINTESTYWRFQVRYEYNPSADNTWAFFLFADHDAAEMYPASTIISGYVIGVNYTGSDDFIKLWEVSSGSESIVINTGYNWQTNITTSGTAGFEIVRSTTGDWSIYIDDNGGFDNLIQIGTTENNEDQTNTSFIGISHEYTMSADQLLWFDDIYMGSEILDTEPPFLTELIATSNNSLLVTFNENLEELSAEALLNYFVDNSIGNPLSATLNPSNYKQVTLTFAASFVDNLSYLLTVNNVEDLYGNPCINQTGTFSYYRIAAMMAVPISATELDVFFNKAVDPLSAENESFYIVNGGIGNPSSAIVDVVNKQLVHLTFLNAFQLNQFYSINISGVEDLYGNSILPTGLEFLFYEVQPFDLVINEIMCDVNPAPEALPLFEYVEIYNNSQNNINLSSWTFTIGTAGEKVFPDVIIPSGDFAIICKEGAETAFEPYGLTIPILNESDLTTTGKRLLIKNGVGNMIEDLTYSIDWYDDSDKDDGGWSMERIDPQNFCGEDENWTVTVDYTGGTPGRINSVFASNPDLSPPVVLELEYISSKQIRVHFSEKVDAMQSTNENAYLLNGSIHPISTILNSESTSAIDLIFNDNFDIGSNTLEISGIEDNCENVMVNYSGVFEYKLIYPISVEVMSANQLKVHFSEKPALFSAQTINNYFINNGVGSPDVAIVGNTDSTTVNLLFATNFTLEQLYTLTIQSVEDINQNMMIPAELEFVYYIPKAFDIVVNEIMADINPEPDGLPASRFVELYNTSPYPIDLTDWVFVAEGQSERILPYITIPSHGYLILCESGHEGLFSVFGSLAPVLTSSDITTSGKNLKLKRPDGFIIEEIDYSDEWYDDAIKDNGGWSLERIDPMNFCGENDNWTASVHPLGGTPGMQNAVYGQNPDNTSPNLLELHIISCNYLILEFDENINFESGSDTLNFYLMNDFNYPALAYTDPQNRKLVHLKFLSQFSDQQSYTLMIENISDNCGNVLDATGCEFVYYRIYPKHLYVIDQNNIKIVFSETVDAGSSGVFSNYVCDQGVGIPDYAVRGSCDSTEIFLHFNNPFPEGKEVTLQISGVKDITGNIMKQTEFKFLYYTPKVKDLVINEVLYDPYSSGSDFVEIYNRSAFPIDLKRLYLATVDDRDSIVSPCLLSDRNLYIFPEMYMAFTSDKNGIMKFYTSENEELIFEKDDFPSYVNGSGTVVLHTDNSTEIDRFNYNDDLHFKLLNNTEGVSLERVNPEFSTQDPSNWHSASESVGFATPAYQNSQYLEEILIGTGKVNIIPHVFSPDNDGYDDYANIAYKFENNGNIANVFVFDAKGRIVVQLAENLLLSQEGTMIWDGLCQDRRIADAGTYLVFFKVFDLNGNISIYKETVILAKKR